ncbi:hypothetical protein KPATCC21470_8233 [Kitasatospora purpeofusca]
MVRRDAPVAKGRGTRRPGRPGGIAIRSFGFVLVGCDPGGRNPVWRCGPPNSGAATNSPQRRMFGPDVRRCAPGSRPVALPAAVAPPRATRRLRSPFPGARPPCGVRERSPCDGRARTDGESSAGLRSVAMRTRSDRRPTGRRLRPPPGGSRRTPGGRPVPHSVPAGDRVGHFIGQNRTRTSRSYFCSISGVFRRPLNFVLP